MSYDNFTHGGCKVNKPAPAIPTRVQEVEAEASEIERIHNIKQHNRADAYERLALYREAYMEALPITTQFYLREQRFQAARMDAHRIALETVRQWPAMMAELEEI